MQSENYWNLFLKSGSVADYLTYLGSKEKEKSDTITNKIYGRGNSYKRDGCGRE